MTGKRAIRLVSTPLALIILLGLLSAGAYWGFKQVTAPIPTPPPTPCDTQTMTDLTPAAVTVRVYNSGSRRGLATSIGQSLRTAGFQVETVGNTTTRALTTLIIGAAADAPEVQFVASWFINPEVQADGRADHTVDIIVGNDYTGMAPSPPPSLTLPSGEVCLPATPTPTPTPGATPSDQPT